MTRYRDTRHRGRTKLVHQQEPPPLRRREMKWILTRMMEPSSWAAAGVVVIGVGVIIGQPALVFAAIAAAVVAFILKEKGVL